MQKGSCMQSMRKRNEITGKRVTAYFAVTRNYDFHLQTERAVKIMFH